MTPSADDRFAIVTPTLNAGELLMETARSVVQNLRDHDNYTIVDGGSTDGSVEAVRAWAPSRVRFMRDAGGGMYEAIRKGFEATDGECMAWLNASDVYLPGALGQVRKAFVRTGAECLHFDDLHIDETGRVISRSRGCVPNPTLALRSGWTPLQDACFWKRAAYERCGGVSPRWRLAGDYDFFLRLFHAASTAHVPGIVSAFRRHPGQLSRTRSAEYGSERRAIRAEFAELGHRRDVRELITRARLAAAYRFGHMTTATSLAGRAVDTVEAYASC